jgi:hypothetical protein
MSSDNNRAGDAGAGIVGAVVGAGIAFAASKIVTDKALRKKILHTAEELKNDLKKKVKNEPSE